tara:strand:+ start:322 stop:621 length:300 start_codon:yes stop_codon:yes gene_type:complete
MKIRHFLKSKLRIIVIVLVVFISFCTLSITTYYYISIYFEEKQMNRDSTRKCKSYRALAEIAYGLYKEDPSGTEWQEKFEEAKKRQSQYKCTPVISISQ